MLYLEFIILQVSTYEFTGGLCRNLALVRCLKRCGICLGGHSNQRTESVVKVNWEVWLLAVNDQVAPLGWVYPNVVAFAVVGI